MRKRRTQTPNQTPYLSVLLLDGARERVDVAEDEVELELVAALVRPEHDCVGGLVEESLEVHAATVRDAQ